MSKNVLLTILILLLLLFFLHQRSKETFNDNNALFDDLMNNHYQQIFPNNANRNAAGYRFFQYIYDNLATDERLFDIYNTFYCAVSGSIVSPSNQNNFDIIKVSDLNGNCVVGRYYRCCTPCNCDIMKYAKVVATNIEMPKNSGNYIVRNLLTIGDPCVNENQIPQGIDRNVFTCQNNLISNGYHVHNNRLTKENGRLVIGILYPLQANDNINTDQSVSMCTGNNDGRFFQSPNNLRYGMGDIFVKLALVNNDKVYNNNLSDLCLENN